MSSPKRYNRPGISVQSDGNVRIVTFDRADTLNAFDEELHEQFLHIWRDIEDDTECRAVVLTGAGRAFSAGGNFEDFDARRTDPSRRRRSMRDARRLVDEMVNVAVPIVAAVNGPAVGLGCTIVSLCDIVFMSEDAHLADPHVAVALVAGDGSAVTWPANTSLLKAKQYLLTGDRIPAATAVELGLANFVSSPTNLLSEATAFAQRLAKLPPQALQETKAILNQHLKANAVRTLGYGLATEDRAHDTPEYEEAAKNMQRRK